jgi:hypothetical protein
MNTRLPSLPKSTDTGTIYVVKRGDAYKIGFTRGRLARRVRDSGGKLVLTITTGQRPSQLEYTLNRRFFAKRLSNYADNDGGKREWFALDDEDIEWLRGLSAFARQLAVTVIPAPSARLTQR